MRRITRGCPLHIRALALILATLTAACGSDAPSTSPTSGTTAAPATEGPESETAPPQGSVATDREVLVAFYNAMDAMDGDNWTNNTNWLRETPLGKWHGVHTNSNGRVFNVRLTDNQLRGEIPVELANLPYLASIEFHGNQLSGEIPSELGSLSNLESLQLGGNYQLIGCIPGALRGVQSDLGGLELPFC